MCCTSVTSDHMSKPTTMLPDDLNSRTASRANAYFALARAFVPPFQMSPGDPDALEGAFKSHGFPLAKVAHRTAHAWRAGLSGPQPLALAYARLFLGPFEILAPPYASMYLDPDGRLMGYVSLQVEKAYTEALLAPSSCPREAPDHVAIELEFMYFLAYQQAASGDRAWRQRQERFWCDHLGLWLPEFARLILQADCHPFYCQLAKLLESFCLSESRTLRSPK